MLHAIIMAGGSGTRLWPESRRNFPKQLMTFSGTRSFLQGTVDRLLPAVRPENIGIVTGARLRDAIARQVPELSEASIIVEPCARNTSGCIALAALWCLKRDPDAVMVLLPADHLIQPAEAFQQTILRAAEIVEHTPEKLVTLGIPPTYPAESFGYVERGAELKETAERKETEIVSENGIPAFEVLRFREKPDRQTAEEYIASGSFFWNAGIFIWKAETILENLRRHAPGVYGPVEKMRSVLHSAEFEETVEREFPKIESISIDYAVMEKAAQDGSVAVLPAPFEWDDVGSWRSLERHFPQDEYGNTLASSPEMPKPVLIKTTDCTIRNTDAAKTVACCGVKDLAVIVTPEVVLVFDRNCEESVREVTQKLKEMNCEELL